MSSEGIKITIPTKDITSTDPQDYLMWSKYNTPKTYYIGSTSYTMPNEAKSETTFNILNISFPDLGYVPIQMFFWSWGGAYSAGSWGHWNGSPHGTYSDIVAYTTSNSFKIDYQFTVIGGGDGQTGLSGSTWNFRYYVLVDKYY